MTKNVDPTNPMYGVMGKRILNLIAPARRLDSQQARRVTPAPRGQLTDPYGDLHADERARGAGR